MLQGSTVRLHKGSICTFEHDGLSATCIVAGFSADEQKWQVTLPDHNYAGVLVPESALRLCFSLLPSSLNDVKRFRKIEYEAAQGSCGRGFVAAEDIPRGQPIFEEAPLVVAFSPSPYDETATTLDHHGVRWRAYAKLAAAARREASTEKTRKDGRLGRALAAFDDLGIAGTVPDHVVDAARQLAEADFANDPTASASPKVRAAHEQHIVNTLMRYHSNQFHFDNGAPDFDLQFSAKAVFVFTSRLNHSCAPNVAMTQKREVLRANGLEFQPERDAGVKLAVAVQDIKRGERLHFCYMPELVDGNMGVAERRARLSRELNFVCGCDRCTAEAGEAVQPSEPAEMVDAAAPAVEAATAGEAAKAADTTRGAGELSKGAKKKKKAKAKKAAAAKGADDETAMADETRAEAAHVATGSEGLAAAGMEEAAVPSNAEATADEKPGKPAAVNRPMAVSGKAAAAAAAAANRAAAAGTPIKPSAPVAASPMSAQRPPPGGRSEVKTSVSVEAGGQRKVTRTTVITQVDGSSSTTVETTVEKPPPPPEAATETETETETKEASKPQAPVGEAAQLAAPPETAQGVAPTEKAAAVAATCTDGVEAPPPLLSMASLVPSAVARVAVAVLLVAVAAGFGARAVSSRARGSASGRAP